MNREDLAQLSPALAVGKPGFAELQDIQHGPAQPSAKLLAARAKASKLPGLNALKSYSVTSPSRIGSQLLLP